MPIYKQTTEITNIDDLLSSVERDIEEVYFGDKQVFTVWGEYDGTLPAQYGANGSVLADYRIYGAAGGVGDYVAPEYKQVHTDTVTIDGIVWDILGYDHDTVYKSDNTLAQHSVTIQAHNVLSDMQFDTKEALFAFDNGLAAGTYHFTVGVQPWYSGDVNKTIQFTLAQALPAGGQLVINNAYNVTMVGATISAFASGTATTAMETVTMSEGSDGTDLGTVTNGLSQDGVINSIQRALLGSNNWQESATRQYLNSSASAGSVWEPKNKWDRPPSWATNLAGFLNGMSADFIANLGTASKTTALNTVTDGGGTGTTLDKVFLLSRSEVYAGNEVTDGEGAAYSYYSDFSDLSAPGTGADGNRIKYRNGAAKYWWLRSPNVGVASNVRYINPAGTLIFGDGAMNSSGVAPACCIPLDDIETNDWLREKFLKNPSTAYGYEVDMNVSDGSLIVTTTTIYIGSDPLGEDEYVDYGEGKVYRYGNNIFDSSAKSGANGYINDRYLTSTGSLQASSLWYVSEYMGVEFKKYKVASGIQSVAAIVEYDENKNFLVAHTYTSSSKIAFEVLSNCKFLRMSVYKNAESSTSLNALQPTDPPVPLPALPTVDGTNIVDYAGQSAAVPSQFYAKYRKEGF